MKLYILLAVLFVAGPSFGTQGDQPAEEKFIKEYFHKFFISQYCDTVAPELFKFNKLKKTSANDSIDLFLMKCKNMTLEKWQEGLSKIQNECRTVTSIERSVDLNDFKDSCSSAQKSSSHSYTVSLQVGRAIFKDLFKDLNCTKIPPAPPTTGAPASH